MKKDTSGISVETEGNTVQVKMSDNQNDPSPIEKMIAKDVMTKKVSDEFDSGLEQSISNSIQIISKLVDTEIKDAKSPTTKSLKDAYSNSLTATGKGEDKVAAFDKYGMSNDTMNFMLWMAMYNDSWVFAKAIDKPAEDQVGCGITINVSQKLEELQNEYKKHEPELIKLVKWGRLFGGSVAVILMDDVKNDELKKKLDLSKITEKTKIRLYVTDRWYGVAQHGNSMVSDLSSIDYGRPVYYDITFANGRTYTVHHSRVMRYEHRDAPNLIKQGYLQGWGYAEGSHILAELSRDDKLKSAISSLVNKSLIEVIKMSGMRGVFNGAIDKKGEAQLAKRLEMVNWGRNFNSLTFLDKDDDYQTSEFNVGGLSDLLEKSMRLVAAAEDMSGILFGDLDGGFSADEVAMERYDNVNHKNCEAYLRKPLEKLLPILAAKFGIKKEDVSFEFNSLLMKKQDEKRLDSLSSFQGIVSQLVSDGMLTISKGAKAIQTYCTKGVIDFGLDDKAIKELEKDEANQLENIDFDNDEDETEETEMTKPTKHTDSKRFRLFRR